MRRDLLTEMQALAGVTQRRPGEFYDPRAVTEMRVGRVVSSGMYSQLNAFGSALAAVYRTAVDLRKTVEMIAFSESRFEKDALALRDGPIQQLQDLTKAAGYAVDSGFGYSLQARSEDGCDSSGYGGSENLDTGLILLIGNIARVKAMWKPVQTKLAGGSNDRDFGAGDSELIKKAVGEFVTKADGLHEKLRAGVLDLVATIAKSDI